mmetsp:Transcript_1185/g.1674  ORF Transcript_1185/g.1674 Transcript_1185/m.1674 type:complete len:274 (-) Transcript_1185:128-949(-)|eukprot:CAMPEP_0196573380 /NCGR_PEP_ID=MMETSP1081-20130531/3284_1 /TAXON_ID=36882 /ORGANISM="Pyramimonas amylifera, Strain CCMP720" /LENGTH=273 /DNA_ID=CAMNT_0041891057 /DNA_START=58 /DNA_END=879 /DNA_ORIENTATION=-
MSFVTTNDGVKLVYSQSGTSGPCVILIHGWSGSRQYFRDSIEELGKSCRVYAYDLRGHGDSDKPAWGAHVARLAADLRDFCTALKLTEVTGVGTSLGCAVMWSYLEMFGQNAALQRCVFVDQAPLQYRFKGDWELGSNGCFNADKLAGLRARLVSDLSGFADENAAGCIQRPPPGDIMEILKAETLKADPYFLGALMADHTQIDWRPLLPTLTLPSLVMIGRKSQCFPWEGVQYVADHIPGAEAVVFEEGDHWLYIEEAARFNELVRSFASKT